MEESDDYAEKTPDYVEISKINKLFLGLFPTYKVHINALPRILVLYVMFDILLPFVDRLFNVVFHSFHC